MKTFCTLLATLLLMTIPARAATTISASATVTNNPGVGLSASVQGIVFRFTNDTPANNTFIRTTNSAAAAATNLYLALAAYPFTTINSISMTNTNAVLIQAILSQALTVTSAGGGSTNWAEIRYGTNTSASGYLLPLPLISNNGTNKMTNIHNDVVELLKWEPGTNEFGANSRAWTNYFLMRNALAASYTNKSFYGGTLGSSAARMQAGGINFSNGAFSVTATSTGTVDNFTISSDGVPYFFSSGANAAERVARFTDLTNQGYQFTSLFNIDTGTSPRTVSLSNTISYAGFWTFDNELTTPQGVITPGLFSVDVSEIYTTESLAEGKASTTFARFGDFLAAQFSFDGTNLYIPNGITLTGLIISNGEWKGYLTGSGTNRGGRYQNVDLEAKTFIATNADIHNLRSTNNALSVGTAEKLVLTHTRLDGVNTNNGSLIHSGATVSTLAAGANLLTRTTNNLVYFTASTGGTINAITNPAGVLADDWFRGVNKTGAALDLAHESGATAAPANCRLLTPGGVTLTIPNNADFLCTYDSVSARWRVTSSSFSTVSALTLTGSTNSLVFNNTNVAGALSDGPYVAVQVSGDTNVFFLQLKRK